MSRDAAGDALKSWSSWLWSRNSNLLSCRIHHFSPPKSFFLFLDFRLFGTQNWGPHFGMTFLRPCDHKFSKKGGKVETDTPGGGWICLSVTGCVTHKHFRKLIHDLRKKEFFPFFLSNPFPNLFVTRGVEKRSAWWWHNEGSLHLSPHLFQCVSPGGGGGVGGWGGS